MFLLPVHCRRCLWFCCCYTWGGALWRNSTNFLSCLKQMNASENKPLTKIEFRRSIKILLELLFPKDNKIHMEHFHLKSIYCWHGKRKSLWIGLRKCLHLKPGQFLCNIFFITKHWLNLSANTKITTTDTVSPTGL